MRWKSISCRRWWAVRGSLVCFLLFFFFFLGGSRARRCYWRSTLHAVRLFFFLCAPLADMLLLSTAYFCHTWKHRKKIRARGKTQKLRALLFPPFSSPSQLRTLKKKNTHTRVMWMRNAEFPYEIFIAVHDTIQNNTTKLNWYRRLGNKSQLCASIGRVLGSNTQKQSEFWTNMSFTLSLAISVMFAIATTRRHIIRPVLGLWNVYPKSLFCFAVDSRKSMSVIYIPWGFLSLSTSAAAALTWTIADFTFHLARARSRYEMLCVSMRSTMAIIDGRRNLASRNLPTDCQ